MSVRNIRVMGDDILNKVSKPVKEMNEKTKVLIEDMLETMYDAGGVGLAAVQVGILKRIVVILGTKVVLLAFKPLLHNPFWGEERKINSIIAMIVLLTRWRN